MRGKLLIWLLCLGIKICHIDAVWLDDWANPCLKHCGNNKVQMKLQITRDRHVF